MQQQEVLQVLPPSHLDTSPAHHLQVFQVVRSGSAGEHLVSLFVINPDIAAIVCKYLKCVSNSNI